MPQIFLVVRFMIVRFCDATGLSRGEWRLPLPKAGWARKDATGLSRGEWRLPLPESRL